MNDYYNSNGEFFTITKSSSSIEVDLDTETGNIENIMVNNKSYSYYVDANNHNYLVWNQNDYVYQVEGTLSKDELLKIAETVK
jgi:hypothetical protein